MWRATKIKNMQVLKPIKVIISGGGTGGHVFPAIAIANKLRSINSDIEVLFVGAKGKLEMEKVPAAGYKIKGLWISGFYRELTFRNLMFPVKLIHSLIKSLSIIKKFKPDVVVGVGGYASGPILFIASLLKVPTLIQEQNSFAGITNRMLGKWVDKICVAHDSMDRFFPSAKTIVSGNPVRSDILNLNASKKECFAHFDLDEEKKTMLIIGGSLGAKTINDSINGGLKQLIDESIQVIWQTGEFYYDDLLPEAMKYGKAVKLTKFITRMDMAYSIADIVVSRAGGLAISELCAVRKPSILLPSPNVTEDHQTQNALSLVEKEAAIMVKDNEAMDHLVPTAIHLINDEEKQRKFYENIGMLAVLDAPQIIADEVLKLGSSN